MTYNHIGIDYKIISIFIQKNNNNSHKTKNKKITKYIGGVDQKKNDLNDLNKIDLDFGECAPHINKKECFNTKQKEYIKNHLKTLNIDSNDEFNINDIKKKMSCDSQKCVALKTGIDINIFKPNGPANSTALLSNLDIDNVLLQFEMKFNNFKALHFTMDDWFNTSYGEHDIAKLGNDPTYICNIIRNNKNCIGFIMNTDKWSGGGIHWTSMFIDMRDNNNWTIEFFNSSGNKPSKNIKKLIDNIINNLYLCNAKPYNCTVTHINITKHEHQLSDTECGLYGLFMIYNRCRGISSNFFENNEYEKIYDDTMIQFRKYVFWHI